jgi:hypothetical protein
MSQVELPIKLWYEYSDVHNVTVSLVLLVVKLEWLKYWKIHTTT